jgi:hypothetical protein
MNSRPTSANDNLAEFKLKGKFIEGAQAMEESNSDMSVTLDVRSRLNRRAYLYLLAVLAVRSAFRADSWF